jgi:hypothetical protein
MQLSRASIPGAKRPASSADFWIVAGLANDDAQNDTACVHRNEHTPLMIRFSNTYFAATGLSSVRRRLTIRDFKRAALFLWM